MISHHKTDDHLLALLAAAVKRGMTPAERAAQRRSFVIAEAGFGSDADEAAHRRAVDSGDTEALARLEMEAKARQDMAAAYMDSTDFPLVGKSHNPPIT